MGLSGDHRRALDGTVGLSGDQYWPGWARRGARVAPRPAHRRRVGRTARRPSPDDDRGTAPGSRSSPLADWRCIAAPAGRVRRPDRVGAHPVGRLPGASPSRPAADAGDAGRVRSRLWHRHTACFPAAQRAPVDQRVDTPAVAAIVAARKRLAWARHAGDGAVPIRPLPPKRASHRRGHAPGQQPAHGKAVTPFVLAMFTDRRVLAGRTSPRWSTTPASGADCGRAGALVRPEMRTC